MQAKVALTKPKSTGSFLYRSNKESEMNIEGKAAASNAPLWRPREEQNRSCNLSAFMDFLAMHPDFPAKGLVGQYEGAHGFHRLSIDFPELFWSGLWDFCGVKGSKGEPPYLMDCDKMPGAHFFPCASLNFAENLLRRRDSGDAIVFWGEDKVKRRLSWEELRELVSRLQQYFIARGVKTGDRVAAIMPNSPEAVAGMMAAASLGAVWSSCSPDFGVKGVLDRFSQIAPKLLMTCDGYYYAGKSFPIADKIADVLAGLPSVREALIFNYLGASARETAAAVSDRAAAWDQALARFPKSEVKFLPLPFNHPLYILYSSGTTGVPKCIVHGAGGTLLQHLKEHRLHCDLKAGERMFYFTTCGWMMWNWLVSALASEATLLLYDGSPMHPSGSVLFDYAESERASFFGASAKYIDSVKKSGLAPRETHTLDALRMIASTGSPLAQESFDYVYESIKPDVHLASISGGTDIVSCFVLGNPLLPVWRGEIQGPGLGMAVDVFDEEGRPLSRGKGELVCTRPFPSMPIGFWSDSSGEKYHAAYFSRFPGVWTHGDFAEWTEHGGIIIHGRSDATLNPGGVRIGTAEVYRQVEQLEEVRESIVVGQDWDNDVRVVLFVVLRDGLSLDKALEDKIKRRIREGASPRHVPAKIVQIPDIPRTKSGKITEIAVRDIINGRQVRNVEALANPEALTCYRDLPELKT
jgi:acetoacetyl-CoA synthetase